MVYRKKEKGPRVLTELELHLMNVVWNLGECTVKDVQGALSQERPLAYTSVATVMKILEQKDFLTIKKGDKAHTYEPKVKRADYESQSLRYLADQVFQGDPSSMVMRLLGESELSREELNSIRKLLNERLRHE
jgi:predicted transcriptional regulator